MKATPIFTPEVKVQEASDVMLLMVSSNVWDLLVIQAQNEGKSPGTILDAAIRAYIEERGCNEAHDLLERLNRQPVAHPEAGRRR